VVRAAYCDNYTRLPEVEAVYEPTSFTSTRTFDQQVEAAQ
jgi:hypothetical protein